MKLDSTLLAPAIAAARHSPRQRSHLVLHRSVEDAAQRFFGALQTASFVRPHRHPDKDETLIAVRGRFLALIFDDRGEVTEPALLAAGGETFGQLIPAGAWHSLIALEDGSAFFEVKNGPYRGAQDAEYAPWSPVEGSVYALAFIERLRARYSAEDS